MLRAVTWLSQQSGRAILKLTQRDYAEQGMSSLVARFGSPGAVNGEVFNALGAKIRGKSKLPKGRRTICFSPHPDDDVISMGGILRKFVENENEMLVAYMTSGNIAVFDHEVRKYVDFLRRLEHDRGIGGIGRRDAGRHACTAFLESKHPGDVDIPEVQDIKRIIRESEAVAGIEVMGLTRDNARFLNLPFYQTGKVKKDPIGPADVAIVRELLEEYKPEIIFVAGDLSDPHGTHRMCKEAIDLRAQGDHLPASGGVAVSRRVAGVGGDGRDVARADVAGGAAARRSRRSSSTSRRRTPRPSPARTIASSGSASTRATRTPPRCSIDSASRSTSRWKRTSSNSDGR